MGHAMKLDSLKQNAGLSEVHIFGLLTSSWIFDDEMLSGTSWLRDIRCFEVQVHSASL